MTSSPTTSGVGRRLMFATVTLVLVLLGMELVARTVERALGARVADVALADSPVLVAGPEGAVHVDPALTTPRGLGGPPMLDVPFPPDPTPGVARVVLLGGSSVVNLCPSRGALAAATLATGVGAWRGVEVLCGGVNAHGSDGVVHVLDAFLAHGVDVAVIYSGHNEFVQARLDALGRPSGLRAVAERLALVRVPSRLLAAARLGHPDAEGARQGRWGEVAVDPMGPDHVVRVLDRYRSNLRAAVLATRAAGGAAVLGTVPSNLWAPSGRTPDDAEVWARFDALRAEGRYAEAAELADGLLRGRAHMQATSAENAIVREVAAELAVPVADVLGAVAAAEPHGVPGETLFRDHCHLDDEGNAVWVATVAPVLAEVLRAHAPR